MLASALALGIFRTSNSGADCAGRLSALGMMRWWDDTVTSPAMVLVWVLGLTLALEGGWFGAPWLTIKLMLVLALSALHGVQSGFLRRLAKSDPRSPPTSLHHAPILILAGAAAIIILVVVKPL
jgi:putative membrane protein